MTCACTQCGRQLPLTTGCLYGSSVPSNKPAVREVDSVSEDHRLKERIQLKCQRVESSCLLWSGAYHKGDQEAAQKKSLNVRFGDRCSISSPVGGIVLSQRNKQLFSVFGGEKTLDLEKIQL